MNGWWLLATVAIGAAALGIYLAEPTTVYLCFGDVWRRPRRVGVNDDDDWDRHHFRRCRNPACWSRVCKYKHGRDNGARSWLWTHEVDWPARPKLWLWCLTWRRRHRVLYIPCPTRGTARWVEDRLLAHYQPPFNVVGVHRRNRHPHRRRAA